MESHSLITELFGSIIEQHLFLESEPYHQPYLWEVVSKLQRKRLVDVEEFPKYHQVTHTTPI